MKSARDDGWVIGGVIRLDNKRRFAHELRRLEGTRIKIHVYNGVTAPARGYYRGEVLAKLAEHIGMDPDALHEVLKRKFNPVVHRFEIVDHTTGEVIEEQETVGGSFEDLGSDGFARIVDAIVQWGREFIGADIRPPTPAEQRELLGKKEPRHGLHADRSRRRPSGGGPIEGA